MWIYIIDGGLIGGVQPVAPHHVSHALVGCGIRPHPPNLVAHTHHPFTGFCGCQYNNDRLRTQPYDTHRTHVQGARTSRPARGHHPSHRMVPPVTPSCNVHTSTRCIISTPIKDLSPYSNDAIPVAIVWRSWHAQSLPMSHCGMSDQVRTTQKGSFFT